MNMRLILQIPMTMILTLASKSNLYNIMYSNFVYEGYISNKCVGFPQLAA